MDTRGSAWSTCLGRGDKGSCIQEEKNRVIDQPVERAHTGLSPRLGHVVDSMRGTNVGSNVDCRPPEDRHNYSHIRREPAPVPRPPKTLSLASGLESAFRQDKHFTRNINSPISFDAGNARIIKIYRSVVSGVTMAVPIPQFKPTRLAKPITGALHSSEPAPIQVRGDRKLSPVSITSPALPLAQPFKQLPPTLREYSSKVYKVEEYASNDEGYAAANASVRPSELVSVPPLHKYYFEAREEGDYAHSHAVAEVLQGVSSQQQQDTRHSFASTSSGKKPTSPQMRGTFLQQGGVLISRSPDPAGREDLPEEAAYASPRGGSLQNVKTSSTKACASPSRGDEEACQLPYSETAVAMRASPKEAETNFGGNGADVLGPDDVKAWLEKRRIFGSAPSPPPQQQEQQPLRGATTQASPRTKGVPAGIGISLSPMPNGGMLVANLVPGGAAMLTGQVVRGDELMEVDGRPVAGSSIPDVIRRILGPTGTEVTLTIVNKDGQRDVTVRRKAAPPPSPRTGAVQDPRPLSSCALPAPHDRGAPTAFAAPLKSDDVPASIGGRHSAHSLQGESPMGSSQRSFRNASWGNVSRPSSVPVLVGGDEDDLKGSRSRRLAGGGFEPVPRSEQEL